MAHVFFALTLLAAASASPVYAQAAEAGAPTNSTVDPARSPASVPQLVYRSPFSTYRGESDTVQLPWREANDRVRAIGGWRVYARETQQHDGKSAPSEPPATQPPPVRQSPPHQ